MLRAAASCFSLLLQEACDGCAASAAEGARITAAALESTAGMSCKMEGEAAEEEALCQGM